MQSKAYDQAQNAGSSPVVTVIVGTAAGVGIEHCGTISTDETWCEADNPHLVTCDVEVEATLTVEAGVTVMFDAGTHLRVGASNPGGLIANGDSLTPITFTSNVSPPSCGDWKGIEFCEHADDVSTSLKHCLIEYAGGNGYANVYCERASPTITDCTVRHSSHYGVYADEGFTEFSGNVITENADYPVKVWGEWVRTLGSGNSMVGNVYDGVEVEGDDMVTTGRWLDQGVPYVIAGDLEIGGLENPQITTAEDCTLRFNPRVGLRVGASNPGALIANRCPGCLITFTSNVTPPLPGDWKGIEFWDSTDDASTVLSTCLIEYAGCNGKGSIYCRQAWPTINHCVIRSSSTYGVYAEECGFGDFSHNMVTGNRDYPLYIYGEYVRTLGWENVLIGNAKDGIEVEGDTVVTTATWLNQGVPYVIAGNLLIEGPASPQLTLAPCCSLRFEPAVWLRVGASNPGALRADGTCGRISFDSNQPWAFPGDWAGIEFREQTIESSSFLKYCWIAHGGGNGLGNIYCKDISSELEIGWCIIFHSLHWGIYLDNSDPYIHDCTFTDNIDGDIGP